MITAIVLAAGESKRIGIPKPLLAIGEKTFVRHIVDNLFQSSVENIIVVLGSNARQIESELQGVDVTFVFNEHYREGQLSSIITGIDTAKSFRSDGFLIHPVDHPDVSPSLIGTLIDTFIKGKSLIVLPAYQGRRGHPVLFSAKLIYELREASQSLGARSVVWNHASEVVTVATQEEGCVLDIDTPDDYGHLQRNL